MSAAQVNYVVSASSAGELGDTESTMSRVSADGRYVVFESRAENLVPGDTNGLSDVFRRDLQLGNAVLVSEAFDGSGSARVSVRAAAMSRSIRPACRAKSPRPVRRSWWATM